MLSIIIVGWNCAEDVGACLESVVRHPPATPFEVIYVDNASHDGSLELVRATHPPARVVANARNVGFQRGCNQGLALARGDEILLLNPDTRVLPGSLDALFGFLRAHPEAGAASPRCVLPDGRLQWSIAPFPSLPIIRAWFWTTHPKVATMVGRVRADRPPVDVPRTQEQDYAYGACFAVKRAVVEAIGPMDEGFYLTGGEVAWSREIQRHGWKTYYVAEATIVHRESVSRARRSWVSEIDWILAHRRLLYRYDGLRAGLVGDLILSVHLVLLLAGAIVRRLARPRTPVAERRGPATP
jgi:GT2 family glycosyltransferase